MNKAEFEQLVRLLRPAVKFLRENANPHQSVVISSSGVKLASNEHYMPIRLIEGVEIPEEPEFDNGLAFMGVGRQDEPRGINAIGITTVAPKLKITPGHSGETPECVLPEPQIDMAKLAEKMNKQLSKRMGY